MIHWGVLGYGNIAKRFIKGLSYSDQGKLYGVASLTSSKRQECLTSFHDIHVYESYEDLLNDENIDAVYIALRHNDHYHWAKEALLHNKAVLCEKPATLTYSQTKELCDLAKKKHTFFMEAMKTRFIPMVDQIKGLIQNKTIGEVISIETSFCSDVEYNEKSYLFDELQGGALYDVGIYNIASILDYIDGHVVDIQVQTKQNDGVDVYDHIQLTFDQGQVAVVEVAIDRHLPKKMIIQGTAGRIIAEPFYRPVEAIVEFNDGESYTGRLEYEYDDFYGEIEEVHRCIGYVQYESQRMSHQDSLDCIELIERIRGKIHA